MSEEIDFTNIEHKISNEYDGKDRVLYKKQCLICEADMWTPKHKYSKRQTCSNKCRIILRKRDANYLKLECDNCGIIFERTEYRASFSKSGKYFCSINCKNKECTKIINEYGECIRCGNKSNFNKLFCSKVCNIEYNKEQKIRKWLMGESEGGTEYGVHGYVKQWMKVMFGEHCSQCGWNKRNPVTGNVTINVDHIDGNPYNHKPNNLRFLCPNCDSLTSTYGNLNKGNGRKERAKKARGRFKED